MIHAVVVREDHTRAGLDDRQPGRELLSFLLDLQGLPADGWALHVLDVHVHIRGVAAAIQPDPTGHGAAPAPVVSRFAVGSFATALRGDGHRRIGRAAGGDGERDEA